MSALWLAAASSSGHRGFDPSSTLPWSVPILLIAPLVGMVMLLVGVRSRRGAATLALLTGLVTLVDVLLVAWARFRDGSVYSATFSWINVSVSFSGDPRFQGFGIDIMLRVTHEVVALLAGLLVVFMACILWHRLAGRQEQGPVRTQVIALLLLLSAVGALLSGDLAALFGFWAVAGVASYLLLGNRWGTEAGARAAQVALALPFLGDLAFLCAVSLLYSRFGATEIDKLVPLLGHTPGVGLQSTSAAAALLLVAVGVRAAVWPFTAWQTATVDAPPAFSALVAAVWPIMAGHLLLLSLPIFGAAGPQPVRVGAWVLAAAAVAGPLLSLASYELRRTLVLASSGAVALCLLAILFPGSAAAGLTGLLAVAGGRAAALLAAAWVAPTMRGVDLRLMGDGQRRMPLITAGLGVSAAAVALAAVAGSAGRRQSVAWVALVVGLFLVAVAIWRVYGAVALGQVPRRRAFEPSRIRDVSGALASAALACAVVGVAAAVLAFIPPWTGFFLPSRPKPPAASVELDWLAPAIIGALLSLAVLGVRKAVALRLSTWPAGAYEAARGLGGATWRERIGPILLAAIGAVELRALPTFEDGLGRGLSSAGSLLARGMPYLPALAGLAILVGALLGVLGMGGRP